MRYQLLDRQLKGFSENVMAVVGLDEKEAAKVATLVAAEVRFLEPVARAQILAASPVPLRDRLDELRAFQAWMELASRDRWERRRQPRSSDRTELHLLCLSWRSVLPRTSKGIQTRFCDAALLYLPYQQLDPGLRNSIAHSNWTYAPGFDALVSWAKKGSDPTEPLSRFEVTSAELNFWQALSRGVAYAAYTSIEAAEGGPRSSET